MEDVPCTVQLGQPGIKYEFGWGFSSIRLTAGRMRKNNHCIETNTTNVAFPQREYENTVLVYTCCKTHHKRYKRIYVPLVFIPHEERKKTFMVRLHLKFNSLDILGKPKRK